MAISELSSEEKIELSKHYTELNDIVKQKEELDSKMIPLCDKLSKLEEEEKVLNEEYDKIFLLNKSGFSSENTSKLVDITNRSIEISKEKESVKYEMKKLSDDFFNVRKEESILREYIEAIVNKKEGSIFSQNDEVVRLDKKGNIVDKINVDSSNFFKIISGENNINKSKNSIIKSSNKVLSVIKSNYKNTKPFVYNLGASLKDKLSKFLELTTSIKTEIVDEFKRGYLEEEERIQNIINHYNKIKEEQEKLEEEANNLEFLSGNEIKGKSNIQNEENSIDQNLNYTRLEDNDLKKDGFNYGDESEVLPVNSKENIESKKIDVNEVISAIDINSESNKNMSSEENKDSVNLFTNIDKFDDELQNSIKMQNFENELQTNKPSIINILKTKKDQFINIRNNKIAKSNQNKKHNMMNLFEMGKKLPTSMGKVVASVSSKKMIDNAKKDAIKELDAKNRQEIIQISDKYKEMRNELEEQKYEQIKNAQNNYNNQLDEIDNIFSGNSLVA